jgi:hypothetical protein
MLVGFEVLTAVVMKSIIFWDMTPCSRRNRFRKPISSTLKMEAICSSETSVETQRDTRRHIPENDTLLYACFLLGLLFDPEDRDDMFVRNFGPSPNCTALQPIRPVKKSVRAILHVELLGFWNLYIV